MNTVCNFYLQKEVEHFLKQLNELDGNPTDIKNLAQKTSFNSVCILLFGRHFQGNDKFLKLNESMEEFLQTTSTFAAENFFPWIALISRKRRRNE